MTYVDLIEMIGVIASIDEAMSGLHFWEWGEYESLAHTRKTWVQDLYSSAMRLGYTVKPYGKTFVLSLNLR